MTPNYGYTKETLKLVDAGAIRDPRSRVVLRSDWRIPHIAFVISAHRVGSTLARR